MCEKRLSTKAPLGAQVSDGADTSADKDVQATKGAFSVKDNLTEAGRDAEKAVVKSVIAQKSKVYAKSYAQSILLGKSEIYAGVLARGAELIGHESNRYLQAIIDGKSPEEAAEEEKKEEEEGCYPRCWESNPHCQLRKKMGRMRFYG